MDQMLTESEVAELTKRAQQTLRNDRHKRIGLPYVKFGRSVRYCLSDILDYIKRHRIALERESRE